MSSAIPQNWWLWELWVGFLSIWTSVHLWSNWTTPELGRSCNLSKTCQDSKMICLACCNQGTRTWSIAIAMVWGQWDGARWVDDSWRLAACRAIWRFERHSSEEATQFDHFRSAPFCWMEETFTSEDVWFLVWARLCKQWKGDKIFLEELEWLSEEFCGQKRICPRLQKHFTPRIPYSYLGNLIILTHQDPARELCAWNPVHPGAIISGIGLLWRH